MPKDVGQRLAELTLTQRSAAYRWLHEHHAEIAAQHPKPKRISWKALAQVAADDGKVFMPDTLRKAWVSLENDLGIANARPAVVTTRREPTRQLPKPVVAHPPIDDDDDPLPDFQPVKGY